jgi:hypothetical protein
MLEMDAAGEVVEVEDLDPSELLGVITAVGRREWAEARNLLRLAHHWRVTHPATSGSGPAVWCQASLAYADCDEALGGEGTPLVSAFAPEPFAAALGVSRSQPGRRARSLRTPTPSVTRPPLMSMRRSRAGWPPVVSQRPR